MKVKHPYRHKPAILRGIRPLPSASLQVSQLRALGPINRKVPYMRMPSRRCLVSGVLLATVLTLTFSSCSSHATTPSLNAPSHTNMPSIVPSVIPTHQPPSPVSVGSFKIAGGKIRCYFPRLEGGVTENEAGLWCFADNNGPNGQDCHSSPGPSAVQMPPDGAPTYYPCSAEDIKEATLHQGSAATVPAGSVVDIASATCHVEATGTSVLCAGYIGHGFSISSTQGTLPEFYDNCKTSDTKVQCTSSAGQPVS